MMGWFWMEGREAQRFCNLCAFALSSLLLTSDF